MPVWITANERDKRVLSFKYFFSIIAVSVYSISLLILAAKTPKNIGARVLTHRCANIKYSIGDRFYALKITLLLFYVG